MLKQKLPVFVSIATRQVFGSEIFLEGQMCKREYAPTTLNDQTATFDQDLQKVRCIPGLPTKNRQQLRDEPFNLIPASFTPAADFSNFPCMKGVSETPHNAFFLVEL